MADYVYGPGRTHLFVPGPVNIPDPVIRAMNRQNEDYRSPAVPALTKILLEDAKKIFKTTSGTPFINQLYQRPLCLSVGRDGSRCMGMG